MAKFVSEMLAVMDEVEASNADKIADALASAMDELVAGFSSSRAQPLSLPARKEIIGKMADVWSDSSVLTLALMKSEFQKAEYKENDLATAQRVASQYVSSYGARQALQVIKTTERQVSDIVRGGIARGEAATAVYSSLINRIPEIASVRAALISRTGAHSATQYASQKLAERSGINLTKGWNSVNDGKTRDFGLSGKISQFNHRVMNGQKVALMQKFQVPTLKGGHELLLFAGDPTGSAGNIINCRCVQSYEEIN